MSTLNGRGVGSVTAHTADFTLTATDNGTGHTNTGASGAIVAALPVATVGLRFSFSVGAAQELRINPSGTETISLPSDGIPGAAGKYLTANAIGETVMLECFIAGNWTTRGNGTWTAEG